MRSLAAVALAIACLLLTAAVPVQAKPLPQTQNALRELVRDVVHDADGDAAQALRDAYALVREAKEEIRGVAVPIVVLNGQLDVRAAGAQPIVRGHEDFLTLAWVGAKDHTPWVGAYWFEANGMARSPNLIQLDGEGSIFLVGSGTLPLPESIDVTYHFLGIDGVHTAHHAGVSRVLDFMPAEDSADFGLALASDVGHPPEALFLTPWNTLGREATMGITVYAGDEVVDEVVVADCDDFDAQHTTAGCRLLYLSLMPTGFTHLALWHLDEQGARVTDVALSLAELQGGYASSL